MVQNEKMLSNKVHILSKSYPRSGHHYFVNILKSFFGKNFHYCEFYQPTVDECCKREPCEKSLNPNFLISMQKSHDFLLVDPVLETSKNLRYFFFFRDFQASIASRTKLHLIYSNKELLKNYGIDSNLIFLKHDKNYYRKALLMLDEYRAFVNLDSYESKLWEWANYYIKFMTKWSAVSTSNNYSSFTINYDDLTDSNLYSILENMLNFVGIEPEISIQECCLQNPLLEPNEKIMDQSFLSDQLMSIHQKTIAAHALHIKNVLRI